jgi:primosomal protein N'
MSRMLVLLNQLKTQADPELLTDSQQAAFDTICDAFRFPETVNLHGPVGSGKTFLVWTLSRILEMPYFPSPAAFDKRSERPTPHAIVDNAAAGERAVRDLLAVAQRKGTHSLLFVTHRPNQMSFQAVALPTPMPHDFDVVYRNLSLLDHYALPPVREGNLWDAIRAVL